MLKRISDEELTALAMPRRWIEYQEGGNQVLSIKLEQEIADAQLAADKKEMREIVNDVDIENPYPPDTLYYNGFNAGVNLFRKALLKALVGEEDGK